MVKQSHNKKGQDQGLDSTSNDNNNND